MQLVNHEQRSDFSSTQFWDYINQISGIDALQLSSYSKPISNILFYIKYIIMFPLKPIETEINLANLVTENIVMKENVETRSRKFCLQNKWKYTEMHDL